jgi:hypothetical protein
MATRLPAKSLKVTAPAFAAPGASIQVKVGGLKWRESFTISVDGATLATGKAPLFFAASATVSLGAAEGAKTVVATGSSEDRTGSCSVTVAKGGGATAFTKRN